MAQLRYTAQQFSDRNNEGEGRVITLLRDGLPNEYIVIPWVALRSESGRGRDCDVMVIGPNGVFLVEVKDWRCQQIIGDFGDPAWILKHFDNSVERREAPVDVLEQKRRIVDGTIHKRGFHFVVVQDILAFPDNTRILLQNKPSRIPKNGMQVGLQIVSYTDLCRYILGYKHQKMNLGEDKVNKIANLYRPLGASKAGSILGQYTIISDEGIYKYNFGECHIFKAMDTSLNRTVKIKQYVFDPFLAPEEMEKQIKLIKRDAQVIQELKKHPSVPSVYTTFKEGDREHIVIEWIEGITLRKYLVEQRVTPDDAKIKKYTKLLTDLCDVLFYMHNKNIYHRDLRPENIMIPQKVDDPPVVILNFENAKVVSLETLATSTRKIGHTDYISPEQKLNPSNIDARDDLYSVAAILYQCLTNRLYDGKTHLRNFNPCVSKSLAKLVHQCLSERDKRPKSAGEMASLLKTATS